MNWLDVKTVWSNFWWLRGFPRFVVPQRCHTCGKVSKCEIDHLRHPCRETGKAIEYQETIAQREATIAYLMAHGGDRNYTYGGGVLMTRPERLLSSSCVMQDVPAKVVDVMPTVGSFRCQYRHKGERDD